jgi:hypothetical protein
MKVLKGLPDVISKYRADKIKSWLMFTKIDDTDLEIDEVTSRKERIYDSGIVRAQSSFHHQHFAAHGFNDTRQTHWHEQVQMTSVLCCS